MEEHRGIGAECEERGGAEIHVAGIAAEDVPGGREHDELQHGVAGEEDVIVADEPRAGEHEAATAAPSRMNEGVRTYRPISPAGRNASVSSRSPNETAGAQDGP